jgi:E3 ubiquitin-protein ligase RBBP6
MSVRYKFKNDLAYTTLNTDGFHISVRDIKKAIVQAKKFGRITDFDLLVSESNTEEVFGNEDDLIPKNTTLIIARHPLPQGQKKIWEEEKSAALNSATVASNDGKSGSSVLFKSNMSKTDLSEEDKISQMMSNSAEMYNQKNWLLLKGRHAYAGQKAPNTYKCNKCNQLGHFIYDCPQNNNPQTVELKRTTGIPRSFLKPATSETPGAKINPQGIYVGAGCCFLRPSILVHKKSNKI